MVGLSGSGPDGTSQTEQSQTFGDDFEEEGDAERSKSEYTSGSPSPNAKSGSKNLDESYSRYSDEDDRRRDASRSRLTDESSRYSDRDPRSRSGSLSRQQSGRSEGSYTPSRGATSATVSPTRGANDSVDPSVDDRISFCVTGNDAFTTHGYPAETVDSLAFSKTGWNGGETGLTSVPFEDPVLSEDGEDDEALRVIVIEDVVGDAEGPCLSIQASTKVAGDGRRYSKGSSIAARGKPAALVSVAKKPDRVHGEEKRPGKSKKWEPPGWDGKFHLVGSINEFVPRGQRVYFSRAASLPELRQELSEMKQRTPALLPSAGKLLSELDKPDREGPKKSYISADSGPPTCYERHQLKGNMKDRDGNVRQWNERFHAGACLFSDRCHPLHRKYFTRDSVFDYGPSQRWRRQMDTEIQPGVWQDNQIRKPVKFPPLGG